MVTECAMLTIAGHQNSRSISIDSFGEQISLPELAPERHELLELGLGFDPFRHNSETQIVCDA